MSQAYQTGFIEKCAEYGIDPDLLIKSANHDLLRPIIGSIAALTGTGALAAGLAADSKDRTADRIVTGAGAGLVGGGLMGTAVASTADLLKSRIPSLGRYAIPLGIGTGLLTAADIGAAAARDPELHTPHKK